MTPSEAHDSAWKREPGHDAMQLAVMQAIHRFMPVFNEGELSTVIAEKAFTSKAGRTFFADLAALYIGGDKTFRHDCWVCYEIKPRIYSAGAVVRQCRVQEAQGQNYARERSAVTYRYSFEVFPVVWANDPLAQTVADLWQFPIHTWDGERLAWLEPSFAMYGGKPGPTP